MNNCEDLGPIRVAHIMGKLCAGGVESVVYNYFRSIDKTKVQFDMYYDSDSTVKPPQDLIDMGARFFEIPPYQHIFKYVLTLSRFFKEYNYPIVHSHINTLSVIPLFAAWIANIPIRIAHNHSVPAGNELFRNMLKYFLKIFAKVFANRYCACSEQAGEWLFGQAAFTAGRIKIINNTIHFPSFSITEEETSRLKETLNLNSKFVVEHIGRFTYAKNHDFLIDTFFEIRNVNPDAILILVGDGELRPDIEKKINNRNLSDNVLLVGNVSNPESYYCLADIILLPSIFEGFPMTVLEAQAAKTPIIVSEAVPDESIISNGCLKLSLKDGVQRWAKEAIAFSDTTVVLNSRSNQYMDTLCSQDLCDWYLNQCM